MDAEEVRRIHAGIEDPGVARTYRRHLFAIRRRRERLDARRTVYNFPIPDDSLTVDSLMSMLEEIYRRHERAFKVNFSVGYILDNVGRDPLEDADDSDPLEPRFYHPFRNAHQLPSPATVISHRHLDRLRRQLETIPFAERLARDRDDTTWVLVLLTNVTFDVTDLPHNRPLGLCTDVELPVFLTDSRSVKDVRGLKSHDSHSLCFFRCLAYLRGARKRKEVDEKSLDYLRLWKGEEFDVEKFRGVFLPDLDELERIFSINICVWRKEEDGHVNTIRTSLAGHEETMYLNIWKDHLMLVTKPDAFVGSYVCGKCSRVFRRSDNLQAHEKQVTCSEERACKESFPGGYFPYTPTLFESLDEALVHTGEDTTYRWFVCIDTKSILQPTEELPEEHFDPVSAKVAEHRLVSVALCSNVPGFEEAVCYLESEPEEVVRKMLLHLEAIQGVTSVMMRKQMSETVRQLDERAAAAVGTVEKNKYSRLQKRLSAYLDCLPVLSYNGSGYDYPLMARYLFPQLEIDSDPDAYVMKKDSSYLCIITSKYSFLDAMLFLGPGTSLAKFLVTFGSPEDGERKSHFPYEMVTSFDVLERVGPCPPYESFESKLKGHNTLEGDRLRYDEMLGRGMTSEEALRRLDLKEVQPTGLQEYQTLRMQWERQGMTCLGDLLRAYNIQDVKPMVDCVIQLWRWVFVVVVVVAVAVVVVVV